MSDYFQDRANREGKPIYRGPDNVNGGPHFVYPEPAPAPKPEASAKHPWLRWQGFQQSEYGGLLGRFGLSMRRNPGERTMTDTLEQRVERLLHEKVAQAALSLEYASPYNLQEQIIMPSDEAAINLLKHAVDQVVDGNLWAEPPLSHQVEPWRSWLRAHEGGVR
jgi:hypothetical protein